MPGRPPKESCHHTPKLRFAGRRWKPAGPLAAGQTAARDRPSRPGRLRPRPHGRVHRKRDAGLRRFRVGDHRSHPALRHGRTPTDAAGRALHRDRAGGRCRAAARGVQHRGGHLRAGQPRNRGGPDSRPCDVGCHPHHHRKGLPDRSPAREPSTLETTRSGPTSRDGLRRQPSDRSPAGSSSAPAPMPDPSPWSRATTCPATGSSPGPSCMPSPPRSRPPRRSRCCPGSERMYVPQYHGGPDGAGHHGR